MFASPSVREKLTGLSEWDNKAVQSYASEYDGFEGLYAPYAYRASDHNPTVFGLTTEIAATATISDPAPLRGDKVTVTGSNVDAGTTVTLALPEGRGTVLGTGVADADGTVAMNLKEGNHPVVLTATDGEKAGAASTLRHPSQDALLRVLRFLSGR